MSNSLRDQLLGLGYRPAPKPERPAERKPEPRTGKSESRERPNRGKPDSRVQRPPRPSPKKSQEEIDLGKAYALRAQKEKDDRIEAERLKQEEARKRREAKAQLAVLLKDKSLNDPAAEIARHFEYGGKIKRIYVTAEQLIELNAGRLGVAQMDGRYLLVPLALLLEAEVIFPPAVALKVDPNAPASDDPYSDPAYQVPDDLVW
jgi:uncharacterized protein YaiL (DUF2058 family)